MLIMVYLNLQPKEENAIINSYYIPHVYKSGIMNEKNLSVPTLKLMIQVNDEQEKMCPVQSSWDPAEQ